MATTGFYDVIGTEFQQINKDPAAIKDYERDWSDFLALVPNGGAADTIATSTWTVEADLTVVRTSNTPTSATIWFRGGVEGQTYHARNTIVTAGGRTEPYTFRVHCKSQ